MDTSENAWPSLPLLDDAVDSLETSEETIHVIDIRAGLPGDVYPPSGPHGVLEILEVIKILQKHDIPCCCVEISALKYYGAPRVRHDWELCVPTDKLESAAAILKSVPYEHVYEFCKDVDIVQLYSLHHTFPRFKVKGYILWFILVPSIDRHMDCTPSNFEYSSNGLPYPRLDVFAQSQLDMRDMVTLEDLIDGMDLTEEWGAKNLDLDRTNDIPWAIEKNKKIRASVPLTLGSCFLEIATAPIVHRDTWNTLVRNKHRRMGEEHPKEFFSTQYYLKDGGDPRLRGSKFA
ncbi:hypothetical protein VTL71DRAFT_12573 [Oculimacula yallundae]|uniref:Uncharacterized protein n=1 Tax=Oculimacula yallundae TaxID=86028 RepID=A0ABR4CNP9_9HELO